MIQIENISEFLNNFRFKKTEIREEKPVIRIRSTVYPEGYSNDFNSISQHIYAEAKKL